MNTPEGTVMWGGLHRWPSKDDLVSSWERQASRAPDRKPNYLLQLSCPASSRCTSCTSSRGCQGRGATDHAIDPHSLHSVALIWSTVMSHTWHVYASRSLTRRATACHSAPRSDRRDMSYSTTGVTGEVSTGATSTPGVPVNRQCRTARQHGVNGCPQCRCLNGIKFIEDRPRALKRPTPAERALFGLEVTSRC